MISRDDQPRRGQPSGPDDNDQDRWVSIGEAAARVMARVSREMALREHPASGRALH